MPTSNKIDCYWATHGADIKTTGQVKPCCIFKEEYSPDIHVKNGLSKYRSSDWYKNFIKYFQEGKKHPGCEMCWNHEKHNLPSRRLEHNKLVADQIDQTNNKDLQMLTFSYGTTCNLACRICGPHSSSKWASIQKQHDNETWPTYNWLKDDKIFFDIIENSENVKYFEFPGGEPLLADTEKHLEILKHLIYLDKAKNTTLNYTTNMTMFPKKDYWNIWKEFKQVLIVGSCDDIEERFEYNRYPAIWDNVYKNIKKYKEKNKTQQNFNFKLNFTVSIFTILRINEISKFFVNNGFEPYINYLDHPKVFSVNLIQPYLKEIIKSTKHPYLVKTITNFYDKDWSNLIPEFKKTIYKYDKQRNQDFEKTFPELIKYIDGKK